MKRAATIVTAGVAVLWACGVAAGAQSAANRAPLAEDVFTNIRLLRGLPIDQFMGTMGVFSAATGLNCSDCHVEESGASWARYADDNALKQTTRRMMQMVDGLNKANFGGRQVITCYTCHRGFRRPAVMPSIDLLYGSPPPEEPGDFITPARGGQASVDDIFTRYLEGLGGAERVTALRSFTGKGTYMGFDDAATSPMEMYAEAPARRAIIGHSPAGDLTWVYDGRTGWLAAPLTDRPLPVMPVTGQELEGLGVEAQVHFPAGLRQTLTNWRVGYAVEIGDREANVVQGTTRGGGVVTLCFDRETGLLIRLVRYANSPVGRIVTRVDYDDYREVAGVKMPFRWTVSWLNGRSVFELESVQPNVAINAARFVRPAR